MTGSPLASSSCSRTLTGVLPSAMLPSKSSWRITAISPVRTRCASWVKRALPKGPSPCSFRQVLALVAEIDADVAVQGLAALLVLHLEADALGRDLLAVQGQHRLQARVEADAHRGDAVGQAGAVDRGEDPVGHLRREDRRAAAASSWPLRTSPGRSPVVPPTAPAPAALIKSRWSWRITFSARTRSSTRRFCARPAGVALAATGTCRAHPGDGDLCRGDAEPVGQVPHYGLGPRLGKGEIVRVTSPGLPGQCGCCPCARSATRCRTSRSLSRFASCSSCLRSFCRGWRWTGQNAGGGRFRAGAGAARLVSVRRMFHSSPWSAPAASAWRTGAGPGW